jgi:hypothetical protein
VGHEVNPEPPQPRQQAQSSGATMSSSTPSAAERRRTWYFLHVLASMTALFVAFMFGLAAYVSVTDEMPKLDLPLAVRVLGSLSIFALFWLWIRMLIDFFRERPSRHPVAWGWFLFLGSYLGALAYFWTVWRPRNK